VALWTIADGFSIVGTRGRRSYRLCATSLLLWMRKSRMRQGNGQANTLKFLHLPPPRELYPYPPRAFLDYAGARSTRVISSSSSCCLHLITARILTTFPCLLAGPSSASSACIYLLYRHPLGYISTDQVNSPARTHSRAVLFIAKPARFLSDFVPLLCACSRFVPLPLSVMGYNYFLLVFCGNNVLLDMCA